MDGFFDVGQRIAAPLAPAPLVYASPDDPGFSRRRCGAGFLYVTASGDKIEEEGVIARLRALAAPPAWTDVWFCAQPSGHLQATGVDARGRKQYIYHPHWRLTRDGAKFDRQSAFGRALPKGRRAALQALRGKDALEAACAVVFELLDRNALRIGNEAYARANGAYGATTLRKRHVKVDGAKIALDFRSEGGKQRQLEIVDRRLARAVRDFESLPGQRLFQYADGDEVKPLTSDAVNRWIKDKMGQDFSAKDFRTFRATSIAAETLLALPRPQSEKERARGVNAACKAAASFLGNTPAICRKSYVSPRLGERWTDGSIDEVAALASASRIRLTRAERITVFLAEG